MDAMAAAGKLLVMEDDTRTRVCNVVPGTFAKLYC